jgi:lytic murein transglycosylase
MRRTVRFDLRLLCAVCLAALCLATSAARAQDPAFQAFLEEIFQEARRQGVSRETFDRETAQLSPDYGLPDVVLPGHPPPSASRQAEFTRTPAEYLSERSLAPLARRGRELLARHRAALDAIERRTGVPGPILIALWGRETAFSTAPLPHDALRALATQAFTGRRAERFRGELVAAFVLIERGLVTRAQLRGSWAGALGPMQMLPSDILRFGTDGDGDGRVDVWRSIPDALATTAARLQQDGWRRGGRWAYEVVPPTGFACTGADPDQRRPIRDWLATGFRVARSLRVPDADQATPASVLQPAGIFGPSFLITPNYFVIKEYNFSDLYVLFVGHLADRIAGEQVFETPWQPVRQLPNRDIEDMQRRLATAGLYRAEVDGRAGMATRLALGRFQQRSGLPLDCWPSAAALERLRR